MRILQPELARRAPPYGGGGGSLRAFRRPHLDAWMLGAMDAWRIGEKKALLFDILRPILRYFDENLMQFRQKYLLGRVLGVPSGKIWSQEAPRQGQGWTKGPQDGPKEAKRGAKMTPRAPQGWQNVSFRVAFR